MSTFKFQPRWKEELIVTGLNDSFILELSMGELSAYLPTEGQWRTKSPSWAKELYPVLKRELEVWCKENAAKLVIEETAGVY